MNSKNYFLHKVVAFLTELEERDLITQKLEIEILVSRTLTE